jgi:hypothetical protein
MENLESHLKALGADDPMIRPWLREGLDILAEMAAAKQHEGALMNACAAAKLKRYRRDPAGYIEASAREAWSCTGAEVPLSRTPEAPLCVFVTAALAAVGINFSPDHVSDLLRGRRDRRRSGKARPR